MTSVNATTDYHQGNTHHQATASTAGVINPSTANKTSAAKSSNASESTTLKKVVPAHMVKPVTRQMSHEGTSHPVSQNSTNQKLFQRIRSSKVEKHNASAMAASNSGNKGVYAGVQSANPRSMSHQMGQSTAETVKAGEQIPSFMANIQKRSLQKQFESIEMKTDTSDNKNFVV